MQRWEFHIEIEQMQQRKAESEKYKIPTYARETVEWY